MGFTKDDLITRGDFDGDTQDENQPSGIAAKANLLYTTRKMIEEEERVLEEKLKPIKELRDKVQAELIQEMHDQKIASLRVLDGDSVVLAKRKSYEVVSEVMALNWAKENHAIKVNMIEVSKKLNAAEEIPACFKVNETEYISLRKNK